MPQTAAEIAARKRRRRRDNIEWRLNSAVWYYNNYNTTDAKLVLISLIEDMPEEFGDEETPPPVEKVVEKGLTPVKSTPTADFRIAGGFSGRFKYVG